MDDQTDAATALQAQHLDLAPESTGHHAGQEALVTGPDTDAEAAPALDADQKTSSAAPANTGSGRFADGAAAEPQGTRTSALITGDDGEADIAASAPIGDETDDEEAGLGEHLAGDEDFGLAARDPSVDGDLDLSSVKTKLGFPVMPRFADETLIPTDAFAGPVSGVLADVDFDDKRGGLLLMRAEHPAHLDPIEYVVVGNQLRVVRNYESVLAVRLLHGDDANVPLRARLFAGSAEAATLQSYHADLTALTRSGLDQARLLGSIAATFAVESKVLAAEMTTTEGQVSKKLTAAWVEAHYPECTAAIGENKRVTWDYLYYVGRAFRAAEKSDDKSGATGKGSEVAKLYAKIMRVAAKAKGADTELSAEEALVALGLKKPAGKKRSTAAKRASGPPAVRSSDLIAGFDDGRRAGGICRRYRAAPAHSARGAGRHVGASP